MRQAASATYYRSRRSSTPGGSVDQSDSRITGVEYGYLSVSMPVPRAVLMWPIVDAMLVG
jgi:hypothetical protein